MTADISDPEAPTRLHRFFLGSPWRTHFAVVLLLGLSLYSYHSYLLSHFSYDDHSLIVANPPIRSFTLDNIRTVLASGRPVRGLTLMLDYRLFGLDAQGYHLTNLLWHTATVFLFYALMVRLFRRPFLAGLSAILFALHPVHSEAVMGITHRKEVLALFFMLLCYHAWLYRPRFPIAATVGTALAFVLAVLGKQVALVMPVILIGHEFYFRKTSFNWRAATYALPLLAAAILVLAAGFFTSAPILRDFYFFGLVRPADFINVGYSDLLATALGVIPHDFRVLLLPVHLHLDPQIPIISFASPKPWLGIAILASLSYAAYAFRREPALGFGIFWTLVNILPVMNLFPTNAFYADRYLYIPSAGSCMLMAGLWDKLYHEHRPWLGPKGARAADAAILWPLMTLILIGIPWSRMNAIWDPEEFYFCDRTAALLVAVVAGGAAGAILILVWERLKIGVRRPLIELALCYAVVTATALGGAVLMEAMLRHRFGLPPLRIVGGWQDTLQFIQNHAVPGPRSSNSFFFRSFTVRAEITNLFIYSFGFPAIMIFITRRLVRAEINLHPNRGTVMAALTLVFLFLATQKATRNSDWTSEIRLWKSTLMEEPRSLHAWNNLGNAYVERKRFDLAADAFEHAAGISPNDFRIHRNLGMTRARNKQFDLAANAFQRAFELSPGDLLSVEGLANSRFEIARAARDREAIKAVIPLYLKALAIDHRSARDHYHLSLCYALLDDYDNALLEVRQALAIDPQNSMYLQHEQKILHFRNH